jgi:MbtH protein
MNGEHSAGVTAQGLGTNRAIDGEGFIVLLNAELQYSLWPSGKPVPDGWSCVKPAAPKAECLAYIEANWTDMRPLSAR